MREERGIKYQFINIREKGMSKGEFTSVVRNGKKSTFGYQPDVWEEWGELSDKSKK